jgi:16S rRNA processing protein RimM
METQSRRETSGRETGGAGAGTGNSRMVCVGVVTGAHGIRGHVRIKSFTAEPGDVARYGPVYDAGGGSPLRLTVTGRSRDLLIARIGGVDDRDAAEALQGHRLFVSRDAFPPTDAEEFYFADLVGLRADVLAEPEHAGTPEPSRMTVGAVAAVHDFGGGDVIEVETGCGATIMVPFTRDAVPEVNIAEGWLVIARLPGLFDPDGAGEDADAASAGEGISPCAERPS